MKNLLNQLSEAQLLYILERFRMDYFQAETEEIPTVKTKKNNINFEAIREMLLNLSASEETYYQKIQLYATESQDPTQLNQVVSMNSWSKGIRITSILLLSKLIAPLQKAQDALAKGISPLEKDYAQQILHQTDPKLDQQVHDALRSWDIEERHQFFQDEDKTPIDVVILTPKPVEFKAVIRLLENTTSVFNTRLKNYYQTGYVAGHRVAVRETTAGNHQVAVETERAIRLFEPQIIILTGMAGGVSHKVNIGDIVIGSRSYYYESGMETTEGFLARPRGNEYHHGLQQLAQSLMYEEQPSWLNFTQHKQPYQVRIGPIAAGEKVITTSRTVIYELLQKNCQDALAVEMEAVGFSYTLHAYEGKVKGINIRSISDMLDGKEGANVKGSRELASENAAAFTIAFLSQIQPFLV